METLSAHCILVVSNEHEQQMLVAEIKSLPQGIRERWAAIFPLLRVDRLNLENGIENVLSIEDVRRDYKDLVDVIGCEEARAELLGLPPSDPSMIDPASNIELTRLIAFSESERMTEAASIAHSEVFAGENREDVWKKRFETLAMHSKHVTITDRYALSDLSRASSGIRWFLEKLSQSKVQTVNLICGDSEVDPRMGEQMLRVELSRLPKHYGGISSLQLTIVADEKFRQAHGRYIRFDNSHVFLVEPGFDCFSKKKFRQTFPCPMVSSRQQAQRESDLAQVHLLRVTLSRQQTKSS